MNYEKCELCPRKCGVNRHISRRFCGGGDKAAVTRAALHFWEEPVISGERGSGTVFFSGCTMRCIFCQNAEISRKNIGKELTDEELADVFRRLEADGAENINLVNPVHFALNIKNALLLAKPGIPVVWNSGGWERPETIREMKGLIDVYLPDFKYRSDEKALKYSGVTNYAETALAAVSEMIAQVGAPEIVGGRITKGVIIRHLVLPTMPRQSVKALRLIKERLPSGAWVSLMCQYIPAGDVSETVCPEINRRLTHGEYSEVLREYKALGFDGFVQELSAADKAFVPVLKD